MESSSEAMRAHLSGAAHEQLVAEKSKLACTSRGVVDIKGKGESLSISDEMMALLLRL